MAVREPILKALLNYKKATTEPEKEAHRRKLRALFESIGTSAAQPFEVMLSTQNALAVTFRDALRGDPLENELLGILTKKYAPVAAQCIPAAPTPPPQSGVTLPGVTLTDEGSFDVLHAELEQRITALREGCGRIVRFNMKDAKNQLLKLVSVLSNLLARAQRSKVAAFAESDAAKRAAGLKNAGAAYTGLFYVTELSKLYVNIALITDSADVAGVPSSISVKPEDNPLAKLLLDFGDDKAIIALMQAGLDADEPAMVAALPAGRKAYELHLAGLDRAITSMNRGAYLSKKVIQVADITMIAISIYQVWKLPAVAGGSPPTILGALPGGAAVGSVVSLPSLARAVEAIRRLVAIGALDGALIAGIGSLGGGPSISLPELQRPTSLAVQTPGGSAGKSPTATMIGTPNGAVVPVGRTPAELLTPNGIRIGQAGANKDIRVIKGGPAEARAFFDQLAAGGSPFVGGYKGSAVTLPGGGFVGLRMVATGSGARAVPAVTIDVRIPGIAIRELKFVP
ncbi:MAG: hypothetical protein HUU21_17070 [Polyangiaceae bacterium]|nr:hypothetical protein [Polyangiaceae bacterium]